MGGARKKIVAREGKISYIYQKKNSENYLSEGGGGREGGRYTYHSRAARHDAGIRPPAASVPGGEAEAWIRRFAAASCTRTPVQRERGDGRDKVRERDDSPRWRKKLKRTRVGKKRNTLRDRARGGGEVGACDVVYARAPRHRKL